LAMTTSKLPADTPPLVITDVDFVRLSKLLDDAGEPIARLAEEMMRATVVPRAEVPPTVATMNSVVVYEDEQTGVRRSVRLVYPGEANVSAGAVSVLAPVGSALLGLSVGQTIEWDVPSARRRFRVVEISYQPEAAGHPDP
jgi:regulator of nucleoside diphosphate kinase